jgi:shikimate 5-dehydrogenase
MILHQALKQFELYTGVPAPFEVFEQAIREANR